MNHLHSKCVDCSRVMSCRVVVFHLFLFHAADINVTFKLFGSIYVGMSSHKPKILAQESWRGRREHNERTNYILFPIPGIRCELDGSLANKVRVSQPPSPSEFGCFDTVISKCKGDQLFHYGSDVEVLACSVSRPYGSWNRQESDCEG